MSEVQIRSREDTYHDGWEDGRNSGYWLGWWSALSAVATGYLASILYRVLGGL